MNDSRSHQGTEHCTLGLARLRELPNVGRIHQLLWEGSTNPCPPPTGTQQSRVCVTTWRDQRRTEHALSFSLRSSKMCSETPSQECEAM